MNVRIQDEDTPAGRIAAVARALAIRMEREFEKTGQGPRIPDYADLRSAIEPYLRRELLVARIDEAARSAAAETKYPRTTRQKELAETLYACEMEIAKTPRP